MDKNPENAIRRARRLSGLTQEKAAEMSGYSRDSVANWENGSRRASVEVLDLLAIIYNAPWLPAVYLREQSSGGLSELVPAFTPGEPLPKTVLALLERVYAFCDRHSDRHLVAIAADGKISEDEQPEFDTIMRELQGIVEAAMSVRYARSEE